MSTNADRTSFAACWCCGEPAPIRGEDDPWEGRLDGYCNSCSSTRCDTSYSTCAVKGHAKGGSAARRRLTLAEVPEEVTFVDEDGNVLAEYGTLTIPPWFAMIVLDKARRWKQSVDTTLERMISRAIRQYVAKRKVAALTAATRQGLARGS